MDILDYVAERLCEAQAESLIDLGINKGKELKGKELKKQYGSITPSMLREYILDKRIV